MRIHQLIEEIKQYHLPLRKSAYEIHRILENNKQLFWQQMDKDIVNTYIKQFSEMADANAREYNSENYKRVFDQTFHSLNYQLDKVI